METEETVKEECVAMSKTKRIWLAFVDIVLFTVLFMIFLFLFAIPFAIAFPELKTQAGGMSVYLMMLNEVLMLASGLIAACMVLGFRKLPFSGLGSIHHAAQQAARAAPQQERHTQHRHRGQRPRRHIQHDLSLSPHGAHLSVSL